METTIADMQGAIAELQGTVAGMQTTIADMQGAIAELQGTVDGMETTIADMQVTITEMQTTLTRVAITQENIVQPQLKLLAEGHESLLESLASQARVEKLEEEVDVLRTAVKGLARDVEELKRAR